MSKPATGDNAEPTATPTPPIAEPAPPNDEAGTDTPDVEAIQADLDKWKAMARKNEAAAKVSPEKLTELRSAAKRLAELEDAGKTEQEKAVSEAVAAERSKLLAEVGQRLAAAKLETALTGIVADPAGVVEDLNLGRYITEEGDVDADAVAALRTKYEGLAAKPSKPGTDLKQGTQGKPLTLDSRIADAQSRGDMETVVALQTQKLLALPNP